LRSLIDDVLDLSALESGGLRLKREATDVYAVADEVVREAAAGARAKGLSVELSGETGIIADADPRRLRQILGNIINNAIKFTAQGGVSVHLERQGSLVAVTTTDTGPGIADDQRAAIFEEFGQLGDERVRRRGTGLGLAIARRLIAMHGGVIELESEVGRGSRFTVKIAAAPTEGSESEEGPAQATAASSGAP